ncbi:MAG: DUF72 domain-containing protein [Flavobacteriales bacterium]
MFHIGTAGWALRSDLLTLFGGTGTHLERYARHFNAVEVDSTFYRLPRPGTIERWAASTPPDFRFAVKMPKEITHVHRLVQVSSGLKYFCDLLAHFGARCGPVLVQLPPSLAFSVSAEEALEQLCELHAGPVVCEPRHASWSTPEVEALLRRLRMGRVVADPARGGDPGAPGGDRSTVYHRLHGSPRIYWSDYGEEELHRWAKAIASVQSEDHWVIFDNTAAGHAWPNALRMAELLRGR